MSVQAEHVIVPAVKYSWRKIAKNMYQCGGIRLRLMNNNRNGKSWYYQIKVDGKWRRAFPKSRPWGYGEAHQAKLGFSKIKTLYYD